jgi:SNF2 family DNA or RNA helicase
MDGTLSAARRGQLAAIFNSQLPLLGTDSLDRPSVLNRDELPSDIRILLMTPKSCGLGLTLTAADTVIFVEHSWNPQVDNQAMDRAHRIGQLKPVTVFRIQGLNSMYALIAVGLGS